MHSWSKFKWLRLRHFASDRDKTSHNYLKGYSLSSYGVKYFVPIFFRRFASHVRLRREANFHIINIHILWVQVRRLCIFFVYVHHYRTIVFLSRELLIFYLFRFCPAYIHILLRKQYIKYDCNDSGTAHATASRSVTAS